LDFLNGEKLSMMPDVWRDVIGSFDAVYHDIFSKVDTHPIAVMVSESFSLFHQAAHVDFDQFTALFDSSPWVTQLQSTITSIQPDFRTLTAELAEISSAAMAKQTQQIFDAFKPDYTKIFASLSDFSTIANAMQTKMITDIIKPDYTDIFASLSSQISAVRTGTNSSTCGDSCR
jgi:hypothetical protein